MSGASGGGDGGRGGIRLEAATAGGRANRREGRKRHVANSLSVILSFTAARAVSLCFAAAVACRIGSASSSTSKIGSP